MIEGLHETYTRGAPVAHIETARVGVSFWRIQFVGSDLVYSIASVDLAANTCGAYAEKWRVSATSIRAFIMEKSSDFDRALYDVPTVYDRSAQFYFGSENARTGDPKHPYDKHSAHLFRMPYSHGDILVLYAFLIDGGRKLISMRWDTYNRIDRTRGYEALLQQQTQLTDAVHGARLRKQQDKREIIERARYL